MIPNNQVNHSFDLTSQSNKQLSLQECYKHQLATSIGKPDLKGQICTCCGLKYQKQILKINFQEIDISYLSSGPILYFAFIKVCLIVSFTLTLIFSIYSLYQNSLQNSQNTFFFNLSILNKRTKSNMIQSILANVSVVIIFMLLQINKNYIKNLKTQYQYELIQNDYSLLFKLQNNQYSQKQIRQCIQYWWVEQQKKNMLTNSNLLYKCQTQFPIQKVIISYETKHLKQLKKQIQRIGNEITNKNCNVQTKYFRLQQIKNLILKKCFKKTNRCIIIFKYPQQKQYILKNQQKTLISIFFPCFKNIFKIKNKQIIIQDIDQPQDILWDNHQIPKKKKYIIRLVIIIIFILAILISLSIVYIILNYLVKIKRINNKNQINTSAIILGLIICFINVSFYSLSEYLTSYQIRGSRIQQKISKIYKIVYAIVLNGGLLLIIFKINQPQMAFGYVQTLCFLQIFTLLMILMRKYLNIQNINKYYNKLKIKYLLFKNQQIKLNQRNFNQIYQKYQLNFDQSYPFIIGVTYLMSLFYWFIPIITVITTAVLIIYLIFQKYNFAYFYKQPKPFKSYLNNQVIKMLDIIPIILSLSNFVGQYYNQQITSGNYLLILDVIIILISLTPLLFQRYKIVDFFQNIFNIQQKMYLNYEYKQFKIGYQFQNPVYKYELIEKNHQEVYKNLQIQLEVLKSSISNTLRLNSFLLHPLKNYTLITTKDQSIDYCYETPFTPRINRTPSPIPSSIPKLPMGRQQTKFSQRNSLQQPLTFNKVFQNLEAGKKEKLIRKIKNQVVKLQK